VLISQLVLSEKYSFALVLGRLVNEASITVIEWPKKVLEFQGGITVTVLLVLNSCFTSRIYHYRAVKKTTLLLFQSRTLLVYEMCGQTDCCGCEYSVLHSVCYIVTCIDLFVIMNVKICKSVNHIHVQCYKKVIPLF